MITSTLLSSVRHRAMITPVSSLRTQAVEPVLKFQAPAPGILIFLAPASTPRSFGSGSGTIRSKKSEKKHCIIYITRLPHKR